MLTLCESSSAVATAPLADVPTTAPLADVPTTAPVAVTTARAAVSNGETSPVQLVEPDNLPEWPSRMLRFQSNQRRALPPLLAKRQVRSQHVDKNDAEGRDGR